MADHPFTGTLSVTDKIGIGIDEPLSQLHIASSTDAPSQAFLESGGALLKLSVDASGASIGTANAFPLSIQTDGTSRISISSTGSVDISASLSVQNTLTISGNVGIGTSTPSQKLEVVGTIKATAFEGNGATLSGVVKAAGDTMTGALTINNNLTVNGNVGIGTASPAARLHIHSNDNDALKITNTALSKTARMGVDHLGVWIEPSETNSSIRLNANPSLFGLYVRGTDGNVGIGTPDPSSKLDVRGNLFVKAEVRADGGFQVDGQTVIDSDAGWHRSYGNTGWYNGTYGGGWYMEDSTWIRSYGGKNIYHNTGVLRTDGTLQVGLEGNRFVVNTSGNVGIGTMAPTAKLQISDGFRGSLKLLGTSGVGHDFGYDGGSDNSFWFAHYGAESGETRFVWENATSSRDLLVIKNNGQVFVQGNVGIGTTSPGTKLDVAGDIKFNSTISTPNRMHITGGERLYLLNKEGVIIGKEWGGNGNLSVQGSKNFMIDHPLEPEHKYLIHSCLEGPEIAVFYRGEAQLEQGEATITLPDYFEALTRKEKRTVMLTPKLEGEAPVSMLAASVVKEGKFVVRRIDDKNLSQKFYWEVKAVRADIEELAVEEMKISTPQAIPL